MFTLTKDLNYIIAFRKELHLPISLPAIVMEDNSAVITITNEDSAHAKKCKHFLMVVNYVKEQITLGQIQARKIYGKLNNADLHTKPLRCPSFTTMTHRILGQPSPSSADYELPSVEDSGLSPALHVGTKHLLPTTPPSSEGAKRRKAHALQYPSRMTRQWTPFLLLRL